MKNGIAPPASPTVVITLTPQGPQLQGNGLSAWQTLMLLQGVIEDVRFQATEERRNADRRVQPATMVPA